MSSKSRLLSLLQAAAGKQLSGQEAAEQLGISRAAVWKAAQALRGQGIPIQATPGGGYCLAGSGPDVLTEATLGAAFTCAPPPLLQVLPETASTNLVAKRWAMEGTPHGSLVVALQQSSGRGRLGRSFSSPPGGVYLSIVLRPAMGFISAGLVTASAAVATVRAVSRLCSIQLGIKWVNDLYFDGKKCCGILTEAATDAETGTIEYMVCGIGLNLSVPASAFTGPLAEVATSLYPQGAAPVGRAQMAAAIHTELLGLFATLPSTAFLAEYRSRSIVLGRPITVMASPPYPATALAIDEEARLIVQPPGGEARTLSTGEISIRL